MVSMVALLPPYLQGCEMRERRQCWIQDVSAGYMQTNVMA